MGGSARSGVVGSSAGILAPVAFILLLAAVLRMPFLDLPLERDEGEYAYIAWRLDFHELPYRDWIDQKPPGIFWVYRLAMELPLDAVRAVHFVGMLFSAASGVALFFVARRFMGRAWAVTAAALFVVLSADPFLQGTAANTELFMLLPLIASHVVYLAAARRDRSARSLFFLTGVLTGLAVAFKQVAIANWLFLVAVDPLIRSEGRRWRGMLGFAAWSTIGMLAVWVPIASWFAVHGGFHDLIDNVLTHNLAYVSALSPSARLELLRTTLATLSRTEAVAWLLSVVGLVWLLVSGKGREFTYLLGWTIASWVGIGASGYFFPHYFQQWIPPLAMCSALGAEALWHAGFWRRLPASGRSAVLLGALALLPVTASYPFFFRYSSAEAVGAIYPGNLFAGMPAFASRLAEVTEPEDRVFVFGSEPEVLFYARRASATRYIILFPLYGPYGDALEKQVDAAKEIALARPSAVVYLPNTLFQVPGSAQELTRWAKEYLEAGFVADSFLTQDPEGAVRVVPGVDGDPPPVRPGEEVRGILLLRSRGMEGS